MSQPTYSPHQVQSGSVPGETAMVMHIPAQPPHIEPMGPMMDCPAAADAASTYKTSTASDLGMC